jgi:hypothetical protein
MEILRTPLDVFVFQKLLFDSLHVNAMELGLFGIPGQGRGFWGNTYACQKFEIAVNNTLIPTWENLRFEGWVGCGNQSRQAPGGTLEFALTPILVQIKK